MTMNKQSSNEQTNKQVSITMNKQTNEQQITMTIDKHNDNE